ncbi:MAG TPA: hypothetical protein VGY99_05450 [Candidatus Binataceae bacterium]|nr:hypothetical protein [Candidatus Binataceae bacterium]
MPPLSKPETLTGKQYVDERAPRKRWSAVVARGRDGHDYDFAGEAVCKSWMGFVSVNLLSDNSGGGIYNKAFPRQWLAKSRCAKDDNRKSVMTDHHWSEMMQRYIH